MSSKTTYEELLEAMPAMAKVVNEFTAEATQRAAFEALLAAKTDTPLQATPGDKSGGATTPAKKVSKKRSKPATTTSTKSRSKKKTASNPSAVNDLNLAPKGKAPFTDFAAEKNPSSQQQKSATIVYWLQFEAGETAITIDHVHTCYRAAGWKTPANLANNLQVVKSRRSWIETADMNKITMTSVGENFVLHDLPKATSA